VSASLSLLVVADINAKSSKLDKAKKLGVNIKTLEEWLNE
jgi:NAD-dependent DNA ligase